MDTWRWGHYIPSINRDPISLWRRLVSQKNRVLLKASFPHCALTSSNNIFMGHLRKSGTRWRSSLRHCATSRKVAGSIPDGVVGSFHWHNPSGLTMALGLTQPLTEMSTRNIFWRVKAVGAYGWQSYHLHVPIVLKSWNLNHLEPSGPVQACNGLALPLLT